MRLLKFISLHCTDTSNPLHDNIETVRKWHTDKPPRGRGWKDIGYHYFINSKGEIFKGRSLSEFPAAVEGYNKYMIAIALHGKDTFQDEQFEACAKLCHNLIKTYNLPQGSVFPHNHWNPHKSCPNFDVKIVLDLMGKLSKI